jgi:hypothetical protein
VESNSQKIISQIEAIVALLNLSNDALAKEYHDFFMQMLARLKKPHDPAKIAEEILKTYGGMATFSDVAICKDGVYLDDEDDKFRKLRTDLYLQCEEIVAQDRGEVLPPALLDAIKKRDTE